MGERLTNKPYGDPNLDNFVKKTTASGELIEVLAVKTTIDFAEITTFTTGEATVTVLGARVGDSVTIGPPAAFESFLIATAWVSAADTVTIRLANISGGSIDPAAADWRVVVHKFV